jgi:hypothetical protein
MKPLFLLSLLGLALSGCSKPSAGRIFAPIHTNLEVYVISKICGEGFGQPYFGKYVVPRWSFTFTNGEGAFSAAIEYKGTQNGTDYYLTTLTAPQGTVGIPAPEEVPYSGQQIELWGDSKDRIGIRPVK